MHQFNAILTIAYRDFTKLLRDRPRVIISFVFPLLFIGVLGSSLQANIGDKLEYNFLTFVFTGVLGQILFQSTASGIISLIEDRENDFSQEIFVSPISRYSIIGGKILGETMVSFVQAIGVILFALLIQIPITPLLLIKVFPAMLIAALFGGAFGIIVLANLNSQRSANQLFPLIIFPQFFLAGVFNPIQELPWYLDILSRLAPMRYAVDFVRNMYYLGSPEAPYTTLMPIYQNLAIIAIMFIIFLAVGTYLFVKNERNR